MSISDIVFLWAAISIGLVAFIAFKPRARHTKDDSYTHPDTLKWIAKQRDVK